MSPLQKFLDWEKAIPNEIFLRQPFDGHWRTYTYRQAGDEIRRIATGLTTLPPRTHVALLSKNCMHWIMADLAIMMSGHVSVPLYATLPSGAIRQVIEHAEVRAIIVGKVDHYQEQRKGIPEGVTRIGIGAYGIQEEIQWESWAQNAPLTTFYPWHPDEVFTIMYTSGTTGKFKGVMHTFGSFNTLTSAGVKDLGFLERPSFFSFLPLSHIAERIGIEATGIYLGAQLSFPESLESFSNDLVNTQPHHFFAVPRLWTKMREGILEKMPQKKLDSLLRIPVVGSIVKKAIKRKLGLARARRIYSGAAPMSIEMLTWFNKLGIEILQAYGLTENCCSHLNRTGNNRLGTVGLPLSCFEVKIAEDGEVRVKSTGNMKGYFKEPELTAAAFDDERFLRTGDLGEVDANGFLTITGRIKDQFKTDKGKYISPAPVEMQFTGHTDVDQVCVVGMGIPQPIALVVLSAAGRTRSPQQVEQGLTNLISEINATLESYEKLTKAVVMKSDWTIENGLLTPTLKIKRNEIERLKVPRYPEWYRTPGSVVWE